ncbi:uncharacterized protein LOC125229894 [Leguminivora glycinivorella]|uniref:uncharacterized protein LOC125229894 n=1 Tax=Leguminivora glycinivorella TaxID=1035111 RepID=UPI00200DA2D8|nr:uncharacterized protein LOC125229894 [Leguminivora glycinivorella]
MALKLPQDRIKKSIIKKYKNPDLSKQENIVEKRKSKLRKRKSWSQFYELDYSEINNNLILKKAEMGSYFGSSSGVPGYSLPYTYQWDVISPPINQLYTVPVPTVPLTLISPPLPIIPTPVLPYTDALYTPTYPTVVPYVADNICPVLDHIYEPISSFAAITPVTTDEDKNETVEDHEVIESLEYYLTLPKDLFPRPKMLTLDPNPIIDELCKIKDVKKHTPWILDLEFGVPRNPIRSRPIAVYDVQFNNIHCKNTPSTVHPLFEICSEEFRKIFLFYYDCIVSVWYRGYIHLTNDDSVINFQNWLRVPMEALGMCWP